MARRHGSKPGKSRSQPRAVNRKDASMKRWEKASDIPMDEEDEFHAARDQILLDGDDLRSDDEGDEDEVFALKGIPDDESDEDEEEDADEDEEDEDDDTYADPGPSTAKSKKKDKKSKAAASSESGSDSEEEETWGRSKAAYYASNAGQIESDDEEANELEEQEAKRLQAKARESMTDADFGLEDVVEGGAEPEDDLFEAPAPVIQKLPEDKASLLRHIEKTNPEALALAGDWDDAARTLIKTQAKITLLEGENLLDKISSGMLHLYYQALLQYATTLAFYLYLRASTKYAQRPELLRAHPIMSRLLTFKQSIATLEDLGVGSEDEDDEDYSELDGEDNDLGLGQRLRGITAEELQSLFADMEAVTSSGRAKKAIPASASAEPAQKKAKKAKAAAEDEPPKKKRKTDAKAAVALPEFDLEEPEFPAKAKSKSKSKVASTADADAYGEQLALHTADAADKAARKRSLRFHTSRIEGAAARRERARAGAGGDDDIPWKERKKEREARNRQEVAATRGALGADLDDAEPEPRVEAGAKRRRGEEEGSGSDGEGDAEGYYDLVQRKSKEKKEKKKAEYEAKQAMAKEGLLVEDTANGPRGVSRAILANKGLTPHRSKSVRNPRVKKRQRYEQAKKKVASQKAVFKGGLAATGRYDGEKSGITKVIKSTRL